MSRKTIPLHAAAMSKLSVVQIIALLAGAASPAWAQYTLTTLATFNGSNGAGPEGSLTLSGNTLYGTTIGGGATDDGVVFSVPVTGGPPTVLASLNGSNGAGPCAGVTLSGNTLYGTTNSGGANGCGAVFSVPITGGSPTALASFNGGSDGAFLFGGVTLSDNTLYGTTEEGGSAYNGKLYSGYGTVFSVPVTGGSPTVLASFNGSNALYPNAGLILSGNTLYGTTTFGGANGVGRISASGTVFSVPVTGGSPTVLASFNGSNGARPFAALTLSGNTLYGTTAGGGAIDDGVVFSVPVTGGPPTVLASFNGSNGAGPCAGVTLSGDTLYGTTYDGGAYGEGEVFSVPITGGSPTVLASFNGSNGEYPYAGLTLSGNTLYGTTNEGGDLSLNGGNGDGTVFELSPSSVPEPASLSLLALGSLRLLVRRRRGAR